MRYPIFWYNGLKNIKIIDPNSLKYADSKSEKIIPKSLLL